MSVETKYFAEREPRVQCVRCEARINARSRCKTQRAEDSKASCNLDGLLDCLHRQSLPHNFFEVVGLAVHIRDVTGYVLNEVYERRAETS